MYGIMWSNSELCGRATFLAVVVMLVSCGEVHNLKCRTTDHSRRQGQFIDIAEECNNSTAGDRSTTRDRSPSGMDTDYYSSSLSTGQSDRKDHNNNYNYNHNNNRRYHAEDGRRNNNREFNVHRQDYTNNNNNNNRGYSDNGNHDMMSCDVQPQQYSGNNGDRQWNYHQEMNPSQDYDMRKSNVNNRQPTRRYRRNVKNKNNNNKRRKAAAADRLLGNNRFRNVTKTVVNPIKGSILDKMDACTIHCVFNQLEMLNSNSRPDKSSIVNIMTNQIKDVELKEFIQDSIDECFDTLELESHINNKCEFTKHFAICMENKAQRNCDDWDETTPMNKMNSAQDGNNQQDKKRH